MSQQKHSAVGQFGNVQTNANSILLILVEWDSKIITFDESCKWFKVTQKKSNIENSKKET